MARLLYRDLRKEVSVLGFEKDKNLINVSGDSVGFGSLQMFRNGVQATGDDGRYILAMYTVWKHCNQIL